MYYVVCMYLLLIRNSLINEHARLFFFRKFSILLAVILAYTFIKFWEKVQPTLLLEAYPFIYFSFFLLPTHLRTE